MAEKPQTNEQPRFNSAFDLFTPSIKAIKFNLPAYAWLFILPLFLTTVTLAFGSAEDPMGVDGGLGAITGIGYLLLLLTTPGFLFTQLKTVRGETVEPLTVFKRGLPYVLRMLGLGIVLAVVLTISFLLLIVPFFFMLRRYFLAPYYLVDRNMGIFASMKASAEDSKKYSGALWGIIGVEILLCVVNFIPVIGWLVYYAMSVGYATAPTIRYEQIKAANAGKEPTTPIEKIA